MYYVLFIKNISLPAPPPFSLRNHVCQERGLARIAKKRAP